MKKFFPLMLMAACTLGFTGCSDNDEPVVPNPDIPTSTEGAFVLNQGNYTLQFEGTLTLLDYASNEASQKLFFKANGRSLGSTPQGGVVYGDKIYLAIYGSNVIEVIDRKTFKSIKQLSLASSEGQSPRSLVVKDGKVYVSMFNGYVSRLDTLSLSIDKTVKVGPNPDVIAIRGNYLYVPNSDGMNWQNGYGTTASKINLDSFTVEKTFEVGLNPTKFASNGKDLFILCRGNYGDIQPKIYRVDDEDNLSEVAEATFMDIKGNNLYYINSPYGTSEILYKILDISTGNTRDMLSDEGVDWPAEVGVDPVNGNIVITSYNIENGNASYTTDGYAKVYNRNGQFLKKYSVGVAPCAIFFNYK